MRNSLSFLLTLLVSLLLAVLFSSALYTLSVAEAVHSGDLDPTFGDQQGFIVGDFGFQEYVTSMVAEPEGQIYVGGQIAYTSVITGDFFLARYSFDGLLDPTFSGGFVTADFYGFEDRAGALALLDDGKILLAGTAVTSESGSKALALGRFNPDGTPDLTFSDDGKFDYAGYPFIDVVALAHQEDGKILAAGTFTSTNQTAFLARFNPDGSLDPAFGGAYAGLVPDGLKGARARDLLLQPDGKIIFGMVKEGFGRRGLLKRYNPDGLLDTTFGNNGIVDITAAPSITNLFSIALQADGKIIVGGSANDTVEENFMLARYNPDGSPDTNYGLGGVTLMNVVRGLDDWVTDIQLQSDGKLVTLGTYNTGTGNNTAMALARFNPNGQSDQTFGTGGVQFLDPGQGESSVALGLQGNSGIVTAASNTYFRIGVTYSDFVLARHQNVIDEPVALPTTVWLPMITRP